MWSQVTNHSVVKLRQMIFSCVCVTVGGITANRADTAVLHLRTGSSTTVQCSFDCFVRIN
jgi:hypothetical protein